MKKILTENLYTIYKINTEKAGEIKKILLFLYINCAYTSMFFIKITNI